MKAKNEMIDTEADLEKTLKTNDKVFVLFYASWCPHSRKFLPIFEKYSGKVKHDCYRMALDDDETVCDKYSIEYFPTVIFFENGEVSKRLDVDPGGDLTEEQLTELLRNCGSGL
jgi:thioredoxin 1